MAVSKLFHGISVIIDDEVGDPTSGIYKIKQQIEQQGCFVVSMEDLPSAESYENLRGASLFILDWNLHTGTITEGDDVELVRIPRQVRKEHIRQLIDFLRSLKAVRFAPVFIFTNEDVETVVHELERHEDLWEEKGNSHIFVKSKHEVTNEGVFEVVNKWLEQRPSAYVLKRWEREYESAKNQLFLDFYNKSVYWPLILWDSFKVDSVPASVELGHLIGRNLLSRMTPFDFDLEPYAKLYQDEVVKDASYKKMLIKVLEGERFLSGDQLHGNSISAGDVFRHQGDYYINIRPECDCVARDGVAQDDVCLYLLKGERVTKAQVSKAYDDTYGLLRERDNEAVIFALVDTITVRFKFNELIVQRWGEWKDRRIGRLLPPFLTRLKQRYSAYLDRPGLSRIPPLAVDRLDDTNEDESAVNAAETSRIKRFLKWAHIWK